MTEWQIAHVALRDRFAGLVLAGIYASGGHRDVAAAMQQEQELQEMRLSPSQIGTLAQARIAEMAYAQATAMLVAREE